MKEIKSKDQLEAGKIYYYSKEGWNHDYLERYSSPYNYLAIPKEGSSGGLVFDCSCYSYSVFHGMATFKCREANQEEIQWFEVCEKAKKAISKEEALKSFEQPKTTNLSSGELRREELTDGGIYKFIFNTNKYGLISKYNKSTFATNANTGEFLNLADNQPYFHNSTHLTHPQYNDVKYFIPTKEELQWYLTCCKEKKFVPKEEALKTVKEESKFEVGKWYKIEANHLSGPWYIKYKSEGTLNYKASCYILDNKEYRDAEASFNKDLKYTLTEVPLSNIQQYLPIGHIDKIKDNKSITKEELLEEAKRRFTIPGTVINSAYIKLKNKGSECNFYKVGSYCESIGDSKNVIWNIDQNGSQLGFLHCDGRWAEIVSVPEVKQTNNEVMNDWIPKIGEHAVMVKAGGWSYEPDNNGCIGLISGVTSKTEDGGIIYYISGKLLNPKSNYRNGNFTSIPVYKKDYGVICRKALNAEIPSSLSSLPEKWAIKQKYPEVNEWLNKNKQSNTTHYNSTQGIHFVHYPALNGNHLYVDLKEDYTEITFEQFKQWVLPKTSMKDQMIDKMNEEVPEYYEFLVDGASNFKKGRIYKCINPHNLEEISNFIGEKGKVDGFTGYNHKKFKPSTLEAYQQQEQSKQLTEVKSVVSEKKWEIGGYIRVIKDGQYNSESYFAKEIYKVKCFSGISIITIEKNGKNVLLRVDDECEWVGMSNPQELLEADLQKVQSGEMKISNYFKELPTTTTITSGDSIITFEGALMDSKLCNKAKRPSESLEFQEPVIVKSSKKQKSKLVIIN